jgi:GT2 family glycosyltransferase
MRQFARDGQPVLYVSLQFSDALTTREVETNITELCLPAPRGLNPYRHLPDGRTVSGMLDALENYLQEHHAGPLTVIVQLPFWRDLAMQIVERRGAVLVYDCMDDHAGFSTNEPAMLEAETRLIEKSDLVIASSRLLQQKAEPQAHRSALIRNACEYNLFAEVEPAAKPIGGQIVVGYYGAIADWFDSDLVCEIAKRRPDWRFQLIGSTYTGDVSRLETLDNVSLLGEQPYGDLPKLIGPWHVCIIPFRILALTEATNPVKVYEMLAAGKPVVSTPLPELQTMAKEGVVALADTAAEFVRQIEAQVKEGRDLSARGRAYAAGNTWEMRYQKLAKELLDLEPLVSIVIVTFHNLELNRLCLASVLNDTSYSRIEVIVVDNASEDGTPEYLKELELSDSRVRVILNDENRGFAAANNQGMAVARGQYLCLLNNDTVVSGDWLTNLVAHCKRQSKLGMVGPVTNAIGNEAKIEVGYEELADMGPWARQYTSTHAGSLEDISMLAMFCVVIPRYVWRRVGLLDERFVSGMFEDDDYNRRVRHAGYQVRLARDSFVHHWQRSSFKLLGEDEYLRIYHENQEKYDAKWAEHPPQNFAQEATLHSLQEKAAEATGTVIFAPSIGWNIHLFQRPHHFARLFARMGYLVIFDCSNAPDQVDLLNEVEPNLFLFRGEPDQLRGLPRTILWTFSYNYDYRDSFSGDVNVLYDWIDDLSVFPYEQEKLARLHHRGLREADLVASVAQRLHKQALEQRPDAIYLPNAVEEGRFERAPEPNPARNDRDLEGFLTTEARVAGYYGALAEWFDYELLCRVAEARPDWRFLLVGPDHDGSIGRSRTGSIANIRWIGPRDYQALPGYLHLFDVAIIPFQINDITLATSPLKLFEYFAGGRPVISTPMPECAAFDEVIVASTPEGFAEALDEAVALAEQPDYGKRLEQVTALNTWRARAESVIVALSALSGEDSGRGNLQPAGSHSLRPGSSVARAGAQDSRPQVFKGDKYLAGRCNICGNETRFFFEDPAEYRESLVCEHCRSTSRYRSIASGLLKAVSVTVDR